VRTYNALADVAVDFAVTTSPEYLKAQAKFGQDPKPKKIKIARIDGTKPTQSYSLAYVVANSTKYEVTMKGEGVTAETVSYTSDASATDAEIATGLVAAINGVTGKNFTATGAATPLTITGDAAGDWFSIEIAAANILGGNMTVVENHADPGIAAELTLVLAEDPEWYWLDTIYNSSAYVAAAAAWANSNKKFYMPCVNETVAITTAVGGGDTLDALKTAAYKWVAGWYHPSPYDMLSSAVIGRFAPTEPGSATAKFKKLAGPAAVNMTATQRLNLVNRAANSYENVAGVNITFEGSTAEATVTSGQPSKFIDSRRNLDWLEDDLAKGLLELKVNNDKIPYTNAGAAMIEGVVRATMTRGVRKGVLASNPAPVVTVPDVTDTSEVTAANKSQRVLPSVKFDAVEEGAVHKTNVTGVVTA
jgi:hypothetical protein